MKTDGLFTSEVFTIDITEHRGKISILPFGDVHYGAPNHAKKDWKAWVKAGEKRVEDNDGVLFLGMGDYFDLLSSSERKSLMCGDFHESSYKTFDQFVESMMDKFLDQISFMKGRCLGIIGGNHSYVFTSGEHAGKTTDIVMAEKLECKYLGVGSTIALRLIKNNTSTIVWIFAHHGKGSSGK